ncbi:MAG TPA: TRAFs-binding domain-containing protein [Spirochaetia bacterium]|nr:TRAFs-binding domain-containing protein [Spirochaetia bacterium]
MQEQKRASFDRFLEQKQNQPNAINELWQSRNEEFWSKDPYFHQRLGEKASERSQFMLAHDIFKDGVRLFPGHPRLTQLYCSTLIKCGFLITARDLLTDMVKKGHLDEETLGILGSVYKEMWLIEGGGAPDHAHLVKSRELYLGAFNRSKGFYSGINAASLSLIMGDSEQSDLLARKVIRLCMEAWRRPPYGDYWTVATVAEAFLLLSRQEQAAKYYGIARARSGQDYSKLASTRKQLNLLARYMTIHPKVMETLRIPPVVAFSGHMLDQAGQRRPRFPETAAEPVKRRIAEILARLDVRIGFASAACGADVLFHECLQERGGESNVVLPFAREDFLETSVNFAGPAWVKRVERILSGGAVVEQATRGGYGGEDQLFAYANRLIMGKAILHSRFLETEPLLLAVWDGAQGGKPGGTAESVQTWKASGFPAIVIDPATASVVAHAKTPRPRRSRHKRGSSAHAGRQTVGILFADIVGYSRLQEEQIPRYVQGFLGGLAQIVQRAGLQPLYKNSWGDAICFMFADLLEAAECALAMRDMVRHTDWKEQGLPKDLSIRIGLHAGPVYGFNEPLQDRWNFFGSHVNQAARIEPITSPGNVYSSDAFAALLLADERNRFDCRYVGVVVLPKDFGKYPIYHVKRLTEVG